MRPAARPFGPRKQTVRTAAEAATANTPATDRSQHETIAGVAAPLEPRPLLQGAEFEPAAVPAFAKSPV
jgi:hypothetical protein